MSSLRGNDGPRFKHLPDAVAPYETITIDKLTPIIGAEIGPRDESEAILSYLYGLAENPLFQCRFRWQENSVAFWDNRCTQHRAMWDYWPHTRSGHRVTVQGERPV